MLTRDRTQGKSALDNAADSVKATYRDAKAEVSPVSR
jgi:hypothetical protein